MDWYVLEDVRRLRRVDYLEKHGSSMLIEEFWCGIDMIVRAGVGASHNHHGQSGRAGGRWVVDTIVVNRRLQ